MAKDICGNVIPTARLKVRVEGGGFYIEESADKGIANLVDVMKDAEDDSEYIISVVYMTDAEYKALPEFDGF